MCEVRVIQSPAQVWVLRKWWYVNQRFKYGLLESEPKPESEFDAWAVEKCIKNEKG